ncbi:MAG: type II toxin-antitoxin system VapC family toxin [Pirellulales bacterium]|nr:type II toxin-antitoxin system VapC family toxin [Pirellulales bacterium]
MAVLVDTCVLISAFNPQASERPVILQALRLLHDAGERFVVTSQNIAEFWNVSTRPIDRNGRGLNIEQVRRMVNVISRVSRLEFESPKSFGIWRGLVERHSVQGISVHDARLVAVMLAGGVSKILTRNESDFRRYLPDGIEILTPQTVIHTPS